MSITIFETAYHAALMGLQFCYFMNLITSYISTVCIFVSNNTLGKNVIKLQNSFVLIHEINFIQKPYLHPINQRNFGNIFEQMSFSIKIICSIQLQNMKAKHYNKLEVKKKLDSASTYFTGLFWNTSLYNISLYNIKCCVSSLCKIYNNNFH